jgi:hypothetical protein
MSTSLLELLHVASVTGHHQGEQQETQRELKTADKKGMQNSTYLLPVQHH